jgi:hypothetical protein
MHCRLLRLLLLSSGWVAWDAHVNGFVFSQNGSRLLDSLRPGSIGTFVGCVPSPMFDAGYLREHVIDISSEREEGSPLAVTRTHLRVFYDVPTLFPNGSAEPRWDLRPSAIGYVPAIGACKVVVKKRTRSG